LNNSISPWIFRNVLLCNLIRIG